VTIKERCEAEARRAEASCTDKGMARAFIYRERYNITEWARECFGSDIAYLPVEP
jgi:hypothetical protein